MDGIGPFFLRVLIFLKQIYWNREKKNMIHAVSAIRWNILFPRSFYNYDPGGNYNNADHPKDCGGR